MSGKRHKLLRNLSFFFLKIKNPRIMKRIFTLISLLFALTVNSQTGQYFYGAGGKDLIQQLIPAPDGNYYLLGSKGGAVNQVWLLKLNPDAGIIWEKTYASSTAGVDEYGHKLTILADGSLLITGQQHYDDVFDDGIAMAIKTDEQGNQIWKRTYANTTALFDAVPHGNNFLLVGWNDNTGASNSGLLMLVNGNGILQWKLNLDVTSQTYIKHIFPTSDGNFLLVGRANVIGVGYQGVFLRKIEPDGNQLWQVLHDTGFREGDIPGQGNDFYSEPLGVVQSPNGDIWITNPMEYNADIALLRFSPEGSLLEEKTYGNATWNEYPLALTLLPGGNKLITGTAVKIASSVDVNGFAMLVNAGGLEVWRKYYGLETATERLFSGAGLSGGQFLLAGMSNAPSGGGLGNADGWVLKVGSDGNVLPWLVTGRVVLDTNGDCTANPGEPPAAGWFVTAENNSEHILMTDAGGNFILNTADGATNFTVNLPDPVAWSICNNGQTVVSNSGNPSANLTFVVQQTDQGCPLTEVSLTQPDLVRCDTSRFFVTVANRGLGASGDMLLKVKLDPALSLVSASEVFSQSGTSLSFQLPALQGFQAKTIEIRVKLACNVQLGASHPVVASISPLECAPSWSGPQYAVEGRCDGSSVRFDLQNSGGGGTGASTIYRVMADDLLAADWTQVNLPEGAAAHDLSFPADGRTWRVELEQAPGYPLASHPAAAVEGCGIGINGLHSISYLDVWHQNEDASDVSAILPFNTTGVPNKVAGSVHGLGLYNLHGDLRPLEFTARARNPLPHPVQKAAFRLSFSEALDVTTFRVLSSNTPVQVSIADDRMINVVMDNLQLDTGSVDRADAMFRFVIRPFPGTPPDSGAASIFLVDGQTYFDNTGPFSIAPGFLNYSETFPVEVDVYNTYPPEIQRFGARNFTFGTDMAQADDGAVFLIGETLSYSDRTNWDALVVKTDPYGKTIWLNAIDLGDRGENTFRGVAPLHDGGCIAIGNYRPGGAENYVNNHYPYFARLDAAGNLLWHKKIRPAGEEYGAWANGVVETADGHFVMFGYTQNANNSGNDQFYIKFNENGDIVWQQYEVITGSAFQPVKGILLPDGGLAFVGANESSVVDADVFLEKIDPNGNILWNTAYSSSDGSIYEHSIAPAPDGGILFAGYIQWAYEPGELGITPIFIKYDANGDYAWEKKPVVGPFAISRPHQIIPAPGGGYLVGGEIYADTLDHGNDVMLLKIDENADTLWWRHYGARNAEWAEDLLVSAPDQILLWGFNQSRPPLWDLRAVLVYTDLEGNLTVDTEEQPLPYPHQTLVFPNPANDRANVVLSPQPARSVNWMVFDVSGRVLERGSSPNGLFEVEVDQFAAGIYFIAFPGSGYPPQRLVVVR